MREILVCTNCHKTWEGDRKVNKNCPVCYGTLDPLNVSIDDWSNYPQNHKDEIVNNSISGINSNRYLHTSIIGGIYENHAAIIDKEKRKSRYYCKK